MNFLRGYIWRYKVAETRLLEAVDSHGGGAELGVIIEEFMKVDYIRRSYEKMHQQGKLGKFLMRAAGRSKILGAIEFVCVDGSEVKRKVFVYRVAVRPKELR